MCGFSYARSHEELYTFVEGKIGNFAGLSNYTYATPVSRDEVDMSTDESGSLSPHESLNNFAVKGALRESALPAIDYCRDEVQ
jgi:hypothetical protein